MAELRDLYQEVILEHSKAPRNFRQLAEGQHAEGFNPLCGDRFIVFLKLDNDMVTDVSFQGSGCAISKASASMMTQAVKGKSKTEAEKLFDAFHKLVTTGESNGDKSALGKLQVFSGVSEFPMRVKCASLAWHTLKAALDGKQESISTE